jgi:hypothetical protein
VSIIYSFLSVRQWLKRPDSSPLAVRQLTHSPSEELVSIEPVWWLGAHLTPDDVLRHASGCDRCRSRSVARDVSDSGIHDSIHRNELQSSLAYGAQSPGGRIPSPRWKVSPEMRVTHLRGVLCERVASGGEGVHAASTRSSMMKLNGRGIGAPRCDGSRWGFEPVAVHHEPLIANQRD